MITFDAHTVSTATPEDIYDVLSDVSTHIEWEGAQSPNKKFHLITLNAPSGPAGPGTTFSSEGENMIGRFYDTSVVTRAERGKLFEFETTARLARKHAKDVQAKFSHRFEIKRDGAGSRIEYTARMEPLNYLPFWLKRGMRGMTRRQVRAMTTKHLRNLATMAEARAKTSG
ncbi:MAG: SRPBCC family protein [Actinomycetota bacterium]